MKNLTLELKEDFEIVEEGVEYALPTYTVIDGKGIERLTDENFHGIRFVRGSKVAGENVLKRDGTLHEHLLAVMIHDLKYKNNLVPSREGSLVITKLEEALGWLRQRQVDRIKRDVVGTYKK